LSETLGEVSWYPIPRRIVTANTDADRELVARCLRNDSPALRELAMRELVERFQRDVFGLCVRMLHHAHDAEDVAQDVFVRVFRSLNGWDTTRPLRPWILAIAMNRCRTAMSQRAKRPELVEYLHETPSHEPEETGTELTHEIRTAVDELRADYREVFVLFHEHGRSYEEISAVTERPVGTIKTWLHRARAEILSRLKRRGLVTDEQPTEPV
jgi:RNA polymerase sigma factor (sigma-70 family)